MPTPYKPPVRWEFDWNRDDTWNHPRSDVTEDVLRYRLRWGSAADTPSSIAVLPGSEQVVEVPGIFADTAQGSITVYDRDGGLDPDNPALQVDEVLLRAPVPVRQLHGDTEIWRGIAVPQHGGALRDTEFFGWELQGRQAGAMRNRVDVLSTPGTLGAFRDEPEIDVSFATDEPLPLGTVSFGGARVKLYEALARLAGGWMVELEDGSLAIRTLAGAHAADPAVLLDESYEADDDVVIAESPDLVRTRATLASQSFQPLTDTDGNARIIGVGTNVYEASTIQNVFTFRLPPDDTTRIDQWETPVAAGATIVRRESSAAGRWIRFAIVTSASGPIQVTFLARVSTLQVTSRRVVSFDGPEEVYGARDLGLQPWLNARLSGSNTIITPFLNAISEPLEMVRATFSEWQASNVALASLSLARPGNVISISLPTKRRGIRTVKVLVLAVRVEGGRTVEPTRTVWGIVTRSRPPDPLVAISAEPVSTTEVQATVQLSLLDGAPVYVRDVLA